MNYMPSIYFCHMACYLFAVRILYEPIDKQNLIIADQIIKKYIFFLGKYYGDYAYDFTIHAHLHLVKQVLEHGPLKSHSQFVFEVSLVVYLLEKLNKIKKIYNLERSSNFTKVNSWF